MRHWGREYPLDCGFACMPSAAGTYSKLIPLSLLQKGQDLSSICKRSTRGAGKLFCGEVQPCGEEGPLP